MEELFICQVCKESKAICCAYKSEKNKDLSYTYCKVCCPWKEDHILSKIQAAKEDSKSKKNWTFSDKAYELLIDLKCSTLTPNEENIVALLELLVDKDK